MIRSEAEIRQRLEYYKASWDWYMSRPIPESQGLKEQHFKALDLLNDSLNLIRWVLGEEE